MLKLKTALPKLVLGKKPTVPSKTTGSLSVDTTAANRKTHETREITSKAEVLKDSYSGYANGVSGVSQGLTIPGPPNSYWSARVEVSCFLPHGPTDEDAKVAIERASNIVQGALSDEALEIQDFWKNL